MKENFFLNIYNGLLKFSQFKRSVNKTNLKDYFHPVGFLLPEKKEQLEKHLKVEINHIPFFEQALTHRSYVAVKHEDKITSNERLEFLGDSVLGLIVTEYLFFIHTNVPEGDLTKMRSWLVNKDSLAKCAEELHLDEFLMMSFSARKSMEHGSLSILADALEAVIGAIFLDSGMERAKEFVINTLFPIVMIKETMTDTNYKSILLETVQAKGFTSPTYSVLESSGPDHDKEFLIGVYVGNELYGSGKGKSKKQAEQAAAQAALEKIRNSLPLSNE